MTCDMPTKAYIPRWPRSPGRSRAAETCASDGRLGVRSGAGGRPVSVTVNVSTPDAESFRRSEAQVSAALARAVARGQRGM
jgi:phage-related minor tail protein